MAFSRTAKTMLLASGRLTATLGTIIIYACLTRILTVHDYATYRQALLVYNTSLPFLSLGLPLALYYFMPLQKERARAVLVENMLLLALMGSVFAIVLLLGGNRLLSTLFNNPDLARSLQIIAPYPLLMLPVLSLPACLMARDRVTPIPIFSLVNKFVMLTLVVGAALVYRTQWAALVALVIAAVIMLGPGLKLMFDSCRTAVSKPTWAGLREQLIYSVPLGAAGIAGIVSINLNQIIVSSICSAEQFAIYVNGAIEIPVIRILMQSIRSVLLPEFVELYKNGQKRKIVELWQVSIVRATVVLAPVMFFCEALAPEAMRILFSSKYAEAAVPFRILLLLLLMRCISPDVVFLAANRSRLVLLHNAVALILNIVLSIIAVQLFGYLGAAVALVIVMYLWAVPFTLVINAQILETSVWRIYPWHEVAKVLAAAVLAGIVLFGRRYLGELHDLVVVIIMAAVYFPLVWLLLRRFRLRDLPDLRSILQGKVFRT